MASRGLGTLTLDLVAKTSGFVAGMDKAERSSAKWRKQVDRDLKTIRGGIDKTLKAGAAAVAAATAVTVALTKKGMDAVNSQATLAKSLDTTYDSITALRLAAGDAGLEGMEGSLTRLNRRLGAAEVGSGAAASAVKALNLDLAALSEMDVDERVASIADSIRDSGVSMQRAARFAQDLGFEQQAAAEFFAQGGDAIRAYRGEVDALGLAMSEIDVAKVQAASNAMGIFGDLTTAVSQRLSVEFSPILQQVATDLENAAKETGGFNSELSDLVDTTVRAVAFVASSIDGIRVVTKAVGSSIALFFLHINRGAVEFADSIYNGPIESLNRLIGVANSIPGINIEPRGLGDFGRSIRTQLETFTGAIEEAKKDMAAGLLEPLAGDRLIAYYENAKVAAEDAAKAAVQFRTASVGGGNELADSEAERRAESIAKEITALERAAATWGMTTEEVKLYGLEVQGATESQLDHARGLLETVAGFEKAKKQQESYLSLVKDLRTDEERLTDELRARLAVMDAIADLSDDERSSVAGRIAASAFDSEQAPSLGFIDSGPLGELSKLDDAERELQSWYDSQLELLSAFREERADLSAEWDAQELELKQQHEDAMANIERARWQAGLGAMQDFLTQTQELRDSDSKRGKDAAKTAAITQATINAYTAATGAYASASAIPVVGWVMGPIAAAAALAAGIANVSKIKGQAHDGLDYVPSTGTYILERGEKVTTAATSAKLDATLDRVQANMAGGNREFGRSRGNTSVNQTINVTGAVDRRTATQIASDTARRQRIASARLG